MQEAERNYADVVARCSTGELEACFLNGFIIASQNMDNRLRLVRDIITADLSLDLSTSGQVLELSDL